MHLSPTRMGKIRPDIYPFPQGGIDWIARMISNGYNLDGRIDDEHESNGYSA